jgi:hypothetical protein
MNMSAKMQIYQSNFKLQAGKKAICMITHSIKNRNRGTNMNYTF